jgi:flagellar hook-associated protein 1 FlgK
MGSVSAPGDLNRLAKAFADRVNQLVTAGDSSAVPLFQYQSTLTAAVSLEVNPAILASTLSAADVTTIPPTGNGRALSLANLAHPNSAADMLDGSSYISFFARISADAGRLSGEAARAVDSHRQMLSQAQTLRAQISGVSLNDEAVNLVAIQRAYEATSRMIATLDEMTKIAVNIGRA